MREKNSPKQDSLNDYIVDVCNAPKIHHGRHTVPTAINDHKLTYELVPATSTE